MGERMRIYIGGLGSSVQEDDLKKTFTSPQLGTVESVEVIRSKGRSFGYLEFVPASEKGLAKLFSMYNGCMWKGGRLKLEKAKENYLSRLQREWEEEAEPKSKLPGKDADKNECVNVLEKPKIQEDIEKMQLKIFFPKFRKIKAVPLKGTGKHKYSFQRIEIPPLPIHFCDCEEHSGPPLCERNWMNVHVTNERQTDDQERGIHEVNENELNMMKTILDKLLEKDNSPKKAPNEDDFTEETNNSVTGADRQVDDDDKEEEVSDEDDLLINVTNQSRERVAVFEDWGQRTTALKSQDSLLRTAKSSCEPLHKMHENEKGRPLNEKKRKLSDQNHANETVPLERKAGKRVQHGSGDDPIATKSRPTDTKSADFSLDVVSSRKSAWRDLVREKGSSSAFHISDILTVDNPKAETKAASDDPAVAPDVSEEDEQDDELSEDEESEIVPDVQPTKPSTSDDKTARGAAWLQKSSWLQLVGDANKSTFNISQILPGDTFEKQGSHLTSRSGGHKVVDEDPKSPIYKDALSAQANPNVSDLMKDLNHISQDEDCYNSDSKQAIEKKDVASALMHRTNSVPNYRAVGDIVISETCPFMRSAASMKEWTKTKAALSGTHKKKGKGKPPVED